MEYITREESCRRRWEMEEAMYWDSIKPKEEKREPLTVVIVKDPEAPTVTVIEPLNNNPF